MVLHARRTLTITGLLALVASCVQAQSFNFDLDFPSTPILGGGVPSSSYGAAAGQAGSWNGVLVTHIGTTPLMGLDGLPTSVNLVGPSGGIGGGHNIVGNTGDFRALMSDARDFGRDGDVTELLFSGLQNGRYRLFTYASSLNLYTLNTQVKVTESISSPIQTCTGPMNVNLFERGKTHTVHDLVVTNHEIHIELRELGTEHDGWLNGLQLQQVPEPASIIALLSGTFAFPRIKGKKRTSRSQAARRQR